MELGGLKGVRSEPALLGAEDHVVRHPGKIELPGQIGDYRLVLLDEGANVLLRADEVAGHAGHVVVGDRGRGFGVVEQRVAADLPRPVVVDLVVQHQRLAVVLEVLEVGRLAQVTADGQDQLAVDGGHARVVAAAVGDELAFPGERRVAVDHPGQRRGDESCSRCSRSRGSYRCPDRQRSRGTRASRPHRPGRCCRPCSRCRPELPNCTLPTCCQAASGCLVIRLTVPEGWPAP